jgi:hypothetical protein
MFGTMGPAPLQYDWYQTIVLVVVHVFAKALDENVLKVHFTE